MAFDAQRFDVDVEGFDVQDLDAEGFGDSALRGDGL
jgi:hypothetical protein